MANVGCLLDYETTMFEVCSIPWGISPCR
jgi:hypothetical protein